MIIVPEIETVVILVPKVASTSLKNAVLTAYPRAFIPYRHMEADGVLRGYERWQKIGLIRRPIQRLWSLYRYCQSLTEDSPGWAPGRAEALRKSTAVPFEDWLRSNTEIFARPDAGNPYYSVNHPKPETSKSQLEYLRPDLGTEVIRYDQITKIANRLVVSLNKANVSPKYDKSFNLPEIMASAGHLHEDAKWAGGWS